VLNVYRKAGNFDDQFGRSYSKNPTVVSDLGTNMIKAQQAGGVAATAKHFPGLGAATATQNTDAGPVTLNLSLATIRSIDEVPFQAAIKAGVKLIMVSWAGGRRAALLRLDPEPRAVRRAGRHGPAALLGPERHPGGSGQGELAAAYRNGTLNGPAFLASVNRAVTLRQSPK
jgi:Glycosyl hydrolase family 3 N terminal domain